MGYPTDLACEKGGGLATTSLEFEYRQGKSRCEILIGGDDISDDVSPMARVASMFVYIRARFRFALIGRNWRGNGGGIQIPETYLVALNFGFDFGDFSSDPQFKISSRE